MQIGAERDMDSIEYDIALFANHPDSQSEVNPHIDLDHPVWISRLGVGYAVFTPDKSQLRSGMVGGWWGSNTSATRTKITVICGLENLRMRVG